MKIKELIIGIFILLIPLIKAEALESTDSAGVKKEKLNKIQEIKEKVAEKVAQLKEQKKIILTGKIKEIKDEKISLITKNNEEKTLLISENTKFFWINSDGKRLKLSLNDFTTNDEIIVLGKTTEDEKIFEVFTIYGKYPLYILFCKLDAPFLLNEKTSCQDVKKDISYSLLLQEKTKTYSFQKNQKLKTIKKEEILAGDFIILKGVKIPNKEEFRLITLIKLDFSSPVPSY